MLNGIVRAPHHLALIWTSVSEETIRKWVKVTSFWLAGEGFGRSARSWMAAKKVHTERLWRHVARGGKRARARLTTRTHHAHVRCDVVELGLDINERASRSQYYRKTRWERNGRFPEVFLDRLKLLFSKFGIFVLGESCSWLFERDLSGRSETMKCIIGIGG